VVKDQTIEATRELFLKLIAPRANFQSSPDKVNF